MKHFPKNIILICVALSAALPLFAEDIYDVIEQAQNAITSRYPSPESRARKQALKDLDKLIESDKAEEEIIQIIKTKFLSSTSPQVQSRSEQAPDFSQLVFRPPLQWTIHSIAIAYDVDSATNILLSVESLYQEEDRKSSDESTGVSSATNFNAGAKTKLELDVGGGIKQPEENAWNPLNWFSAKAGYEWVTSGYVGIDYNRTKSSQWNERAQRALTNMFEEKAQILRNTKISNCHLTFAITFKNNTDLDLFLAPQSFSIPVYAGNELLTNAVPVTPSRELFEIPRNSENSDLMLRANLGTTSALKLIQYMRSHEPSIRMERGQTIISSGDGVIRNAVQQSVQVETVPFRCRDLELRIRKTNQGKATTVADAMRAINAVFSSAPFEFNEEGACVSLMGIPLLSSGEKHTEHRLPLIGINGSFTCEPIPASSLNRPISDEGLTVDVWDITDSEMWKDASAQLQAYMLPHLKAVAESGDAQAQFQLGHCYYWGYGTRKDDVEAVKWWRLAAEQGFAKAQYDLAKCYSDGEGVSQNYPEAVKWYRKAADQGDAKAQFNLGCCYANGEGVSQNYPEAAKWWRKAAEQGNVYAQYNLGMLCSNGHGGTKDVVEAVKWFRKAAEQGNADAQAQLGWCYFEGEGVTKDYSEAAKWWRSAAEQGLAIAQYNLAFRYKNGEGVTKDYSEAIKWFRKAAEQGFAGAEYQLGLCYYLGEGIAKDYSEAAKWFRKAAEQGDDYAQSQLGILYLAGDGVGKNPAEGVRWLQKAATQGNAYAQLFLGSSYRTGYGVARDYYTAAQYFRMAAEKGLPLAQYELGCCYRDGDGVKADRSEAIKWFRMAADQGYEQARQALRQMLGY